MQNCRRRLKIQFAIQHILIALDGTKNKQDRLHRRGKKNPTNRFMETDEPSFTQVEFDQQFEAHGEMEWDESNLRNNFPTLSN